MDRERILSQETGPQREQAKDNTAKEIVVVLWCWTRFKRPKATAYFVKELLENWTKADDIQIITSWAVEALPWISESDWMQSKIQWLLIWMGLPDISITMENQAIDTESNISHSQKIIWSDTNARISIISDDYHLQRVRQIAKRHWMKANLVNAHETVVRWLWSPARYTKQRSRSQIIHPFFRNSFKMAQEMISKKNFQDIFEEYRPLLRSNARQLRKHHKNNVEQRVLTRLDRTKKWRDLMRKLALQRKIVSK